MLRVSLPLRGNLRIGSRAALAVALASSAAIGMTAVPSAAVAQSKKTNEKPAPKTDYSKPFIAAAGPLEKAVSDLQADATAKPLLDQAKTADSASLPGIQAQIDAKMGGAKAMLASAQAAASTPDDKLAAGQIALNVGNALNDPALQREGLQQMLATGKVAPEKQGQFNFYVGSLTYNAKDYAVAQTYLRKAIELGYRENSAELMLPESYFRANQVPAGLDALKWVIDSRNQAGGAPDENLIKIGLKAAYENKLPQTGEWTSMLVSQFPTPANWRTASQILLQTTNMSEAETLDTLRFMRRVGALETAAEYSAYLQAADPRRMANEALAVANEGIAAGKLNADTAFVKEVRSIAQTRAAPDRKEAPTLVNEARNAATSRTALGVADTFLSYGAAADAEAMYKVALEKGVSDKNETLTRLGLTQIDQGKWVDAKATFGQVTGSRTALAKLYLAYISSKSA